MAPRLSSRVDPLRSSVFAVLQRRMATYEGERFPLHIGDNAIAPPERARWERVEADRFGVPYAYGHPGGALALRRALAQKVARRNGMDWASEEHVQVSVGATHAVACTMQALLDPGDEILMLAPYWPLARGIAHCAAAQPTEVPFYQALLEDPEADPAALIEPFIGPRTRMIYLISPNNPNGLVMSRAQLERVADVARRRDLWVLSDEAYEAYTYRDDRPHVSIATLAEMAERTVSVYTFSKTYALAGVRIGYAVAPARAASAIRKVATHSVYNPAQACQAMAAVALEDDRRFLDAARASYAASAALVSEQLQAPHFPAQGGSFVFVDLREFGEDPMPILEQAADVGVTLAPGAIFGQAFQGYARLCYTAIDREHLAQGIARLNQVLTRLRR